MKKFLSVLLAALIICSVFTLTAFASQDKSADTGAKEEPSFEDMKEMEFEIDGEAFVDSLEFLGKGMFGIFVVTLVIIGAVAILNWHGRSLERRNQNKDE